MTATMLFLTIPTAHSHPELLQAIINEASVPRERIILVATKPDLTLPEGCVIIEDFGPPNIQRWWNTGIEEATHRGATAVAVLNDDLTINDQTLPTLHQKLRETNATIATPTRADWGAGHYTNTNLFPYTPVIWGCLWMVDTTKDLRPDPQYVWWYGDSDLDIRARRDYAGIVSADVYYEHYFPGEGTGANQDLVEQTRRDGETFERNYAEFLRTSRATPPRKLYIQTQQFAGRSQPESTYRQDFRDYVATQGDPTRDRIVLLEPNADLRHELAQLWSNWGNVLLLGIDLSASPTDKLQEIISQVTPGADLEMVAFDSQGLSLPDMSLTQPKPRELIACFIDSTEQTLREQANDCGLTYIGQAWGSDRLHAVFGSSKPGRLVGVVNRATSSLRKKNKNR